VAVYEYSAYGAPRLLARIVVPALAPANLIAAPTTGTYSAAGTTITIVEGINQTTQTPENFVAEITHAEVRHPIDANGSRPDAMWSLRVGETDLNGLWLTATDQLNMFPVADRLHGGHAGRVFFGHSLLRALQYATAIRQGKLAPSALPPNIPLYCASIKVAPNTAFQARVISQAGWGQSGSALQPLEILLYGHVEETTTVDAYADAFPTLVNVGQLEPPWGGIAFAYPIPPEGFSSKTWSQVFGGVQQVNGIQINRVITEAVNLQPIANDSARYVYSNRSAVGGAPNNVGLYSNPTDTQDADLGDVKSTTNLFIWTHFGVAFDPSQITAGANPEVSVQMYVGTQTVLPNPPNGRRISLRNNPFAWGRRYPQGPGSAVWLPLPPINRFGPVLSVGEGVAPAISTAGLSTLPAKSVHVLKAGYRIVASEASKLTLTALPS